MAKAVFDRDSRGIVKGKSVKEVLRYFYRISYIETNNKVVEIGDYKIIPKYLGLILITNKTFSVKISYWNSYSKWIKSDEENNALIMGDRFILDNINLNELKLKYIELIKSIKDNKRAELACKGRLEYDEKEIEYSRKERLECIFEYAKELTSIVDNRYKYTVEFNIENNEFNKRQYIQSLNLEYKKIGINSFSIDIILKKRLDLKNTSEESIFELISPIVGIDEIVVNFLINNKNQTIIDLFFENIEYFEYNFKHKIYEVKK